MLNKSCLKCEKPPYAKELCKNHYTRDYYDKTGYAKIYHLRNREKRNEESRKYQKTEKGKAARKRASTKPKTRFLKFLSQAKKRKLEVNITFAQYEELISQLCSYCEGPLPRTGSGLDRKNNSIGYTIENCLSCCGNCNILKGSNLTYEETIAIIRLLKQLRNGKIWDGE